jgi:hypothetical protein
MYAKTQKHLQYSLGQLDERPANAGQLKIVFSHYPNYNEILTATQALRAEEKAVVLGGHIHKSECGDQMSCTIGGGGALHDGVQGFLSIYIVGPKSGSGDDGSDSWRIVPIVQETSGAGDVLPSTYKQGACSF